MNLISEHKIKLKQLILDKTGLDIDASSNTRHFFTCEFGRIFEQNDPQQYKDRLLYFHYFLNQIEKVKIHYKKDFNGYIAKLSTDASNCIGEKFEILTYAKLIDKSISFSKPKDSPDFEFKFTDSPVFIECGTRQTNNKGRFIESIEQAIKNKQTKGIEQNYANRNTALHIEVSKTVYNSIDEKDFLDVPVMENILNKIIPDVSYGAIVIISTFYAKEDGIVYGHPLIKYNIDYNPDLKVLHDTLFNLQPLTVSRIYKTHI